MSSKKSISIFMLAAVCMEVALMSQHADGAGSCEPVLTAMTACRNYLKQGGAVPDDCCKGVRSLNAAANTAAVKRSYCECLKSEAKSLGVKQQFASNLPRICNVDIGYPISYNTNCSSIH